MLKHGAIGILHADGTKHEPRYPCPKCAGLTRFDWELVTGREKGEEPAIACELCGSLLDERARRRMLPRVKWVASADDPADDDTLSFGLGRRDSARSSLGQVCREYRRARLAVERGDRSAIKAFRNVVLGLPGEDGAADVDALYARRERRFTLASVEHVTAGVDVQTDRLVFAVVAWSAGNRDAWILETGIVQGDPRHDGVWQSLGSTLRARRDPLPVAGVSVDAGYLTADVQRQCGMRRWLPVVGRSGTAVPLASRVKGSGLATMGADDVSAWWSGQVAAGRVHLPASMNRREVAEICAAEALTVEGGAVRWRPIAGRVNHLWDAARLAAHHRHFAPRTRQRSRPRLVGIG